MSSGVLLRDLGAVGLGVSTTVGKILVVPAETATLTNWGRQVPWCRCIWC